MGCAPGGAERRRGASPRGRAPSTLSSRCTCRLGGTAVVAGDQGRDVPRDDLGERAIAVAAPGPVAHTLADVYLRQVRQVMHIDVGRQLAVPLRRREQLTEHVGVRVVGPVTGEDAVLLPIALEDRLHNQLAWIAR